MAYHFSFPLVFIHFSSYYFLCVLKRVLPTLRFSIDKYRTTRSWMIRKKECPPPSSYFQIRMVGPWYINESYPFWISGSLWVSDRSWEFCLSKWTWIRNFMFKGWSFLLGQSISGLITPPVLKTLEGLSTDAGYVICRVLCKMERRAFLFKN